MEKQSLTNNGKARKSNASKRGGGSLGLNFSKDNFKDWDCGPGYKCEKLLGQGSYGSVA